MGVGTGVGVGLGEGEGLGVGRGVGLGAAEGVGPAASGAAGWDGSPPLHAPRHSAITQAIRRTKVFFFTDFMLVTSNKLG